MSLIAWADGVGAARALYLVFAGTVLGSALGASVGDAVFQLLR